MAVKTPEPKADWIEPEVEELDGPPADLGIYIKSADGTILASNFPTLEDAQLCADGTYADAEVEIVNG